MNVQNQTDPLHESEADGTRSWPTLDDIMADDLNPGDLVFIDDQIFEFMAKVPRGPHVFWNGTDHKEHRFGTAELQKLIEEKRYYRAGRERPRGHAFTAPVGMADRVTQIYNAIPSKPRAKAKVKWRYVAAFRQKMIAAETSGKTFARNEENAQIVIDEVNRQIDRENAAADEPEQLIMKPTAQSPRSLLRWVAKEMELNLQEAGLAHMNSLRTPPKRLPQLVFDITARLVRECVRISPNLGPAKLHFLVCEEIKDHNRRNRTDVPEPSVGTVNNEYLRYDAWRRMAAKEGVQKADLEYGAVGKHPRPERILDLVELDHHKFDLHASMPNSQLAKGLKSIGIDRFWLCLALDVHSNYPLGFAISFEPGGLHPAMRAIDHAIRPKTYVAERYPEIQGALLGHGKPVKFRYDNGKEFVGDQIAANLARIGVGFELAIPGKPDSKPYVERHFGTIEHDFVHWLKGTTGSSPKDKGDRVPQKEALVDLDAFQRLFHQYLIEVYARRPQQGLDYDTPEQRWLRGAQNPAHRPRALTAHEQDQWDVVTTLELELSATDEGLRWKNLFYQSEDLQTLRRFSSDYGPRKLNGTKLRVRIPMNNVGKAYVSVPRDAVPRGQIDAPQEIVVNCTNPHVVNRTVWQHEVVCDYLKAKKKNALNHTDYRQAFVRLFGNALTAMGLKPAGERGPKVTLTNGQAPRFAGLFLGGDGAPALERTLETAEKYDFLEAAADREWESHAATSGRSIASPIKEQATPSSPTAPPMADLPVPETDHTPIIPAASPTAKQSHWAFDEILDDPDDFKDFASGGN